MAEEAAVVSRPTRQLSSRAGWSDIKARHPWLVFLLSRVARLVVVCALLLVGTFLMVRLMPGDPARRILGLQATPEALELTRHRLGLDRPQFEQLWSYCWNALHLDFGESFSQGVPVRELIAERFPKTVELAAAATMVLLIVGFGVGTLMAVLTRDGRRPRLDATYGTSMGALSAVPDFVLAALFAVVFGLYLQWFPVAGDNGLSSLTLPTLAVAIPGIGFLSRVVRAEALDVLSQNYVRTARAKRLTGRRIYIRHVMPNAAYGGVTLAGVSFASLVGGTVVVEQVFNWPGMGSALTSAVVNRDYPVVQAGVLLLGATVVIVNTLVDVLLAIVDPGALREN
ncbi:ABC transporter permease [Microtetraspora malaysiensis]|uniref:ABC transporter permease n=1 Tax=Microtetraspora malaysiensis TaxID=161358 RepID=UPI003D8A5055